MANCKGHKPSANGEKQCRTDARSDPSFPGCRCHKPGISTCLSESCACVVSGRECDPRICGEKCDTHCRNMAIQRAKPKKTRKGQSSITGGGIGLFTAEVLHQDDFIGEYRGEKITKKEGERRALDAQNNNRANYIFALNDYEDVDAGRGGNHTKWINNADIDQTNCYAANLVIDGKNRVGIFAADRVEKGQELFFHYYWPKEFTQAFGTPPDFQGPPPPEQQLLERHARFERRNRRRSPRHKRVG
ncbi:hypothetical protein HBH70_222550 [Parastagonospora nodorum]|nr:hypothetical protein HBH53_226210 [Parastagonospora nodorum]KAH3994085.1 hypothetical protein HBI10_193780 [Parastagonospora nodorum]KAH4008742.1 hypothetical protein HBI13_232190 [Parastagonospora nodorum]KAH4084425.1 hypothetical protein HBH46_212180 [Parastagonospora nodorum]KAH4111756.1 hypothetical protein HBH47_236480 [Parastagonospora nodorum]